MGKAGSGGGPLTPAVAREVTPEEADATSKPVLGITFSTRGERETVLVVDAAVVRRDGTCWRLSRAVTAELPEDALEPDVE